MNWISILLKKDRKQFLSYRWKFYVSAAGSETLDYAETALTDLLMKRFGNDEDAFSVTDQSKIMDTMESVNNTMSLMIGGIAAISLLVVGFGLYPAGKAAAKNPIEVLRYTG